MGHYYLNLTRTSDGDFEVHEQSCYWLGLVKDKQYLGYFLHCSEAVAAAKRIYTHVYGINGCKHCSQACHVS